WQFNENEKTKIDFLIYDSDGRFRSEYFPKGIWECGRSKNFYPESSEIRYLENLERTRGKTRIYGSILLYAGRESAAGRKIRIVGNDKTYETITDKDGDYEIYDLPAGEYRIEPEIPKGWQIDLNAMLSFRFARYYGEIPKDEKPTGLRISLR